jgi:hypothetical protein
MLRKIKNRSHLNGILRAGKSSLLSIHEKKQKMGGLT